MAMNTTQSLIVSPSFCHSSPRCSGAFPKCVHRSPNHEGNRAAPSTTGHPHQPSLSSATAAQETEVAEEGTNYLWNVVTKSRHEQTKEGGESTGGGR